MTRTTCAITARNRLTMKRRLLPVAGKVRMWTPDPHSGLPTLSRLRTTLSTGDER